MSSWLPGLSVFGAVRPHPVFGGHKPKIDNCGLRRPGAVRREKSLLDVEMDVGRGEIVARFAASGLTNPNSWHALTVLFHDLNHYSSGIGSTGSSSMHAFPRGNTHSCV
jgi:hypothetical protein